MRYIYSCIVGLLIMCGVSAQTVKQLQQQQKELKAQIENTNKMLKQTQQTKTSTVNKLELINRNIQNQRKLITNIGNEITALDREMATLGNRRSDLEQKQERLKAQYAQLIRETHYAQIQQSPLLFLLSSKDFQQLRKRIQYMLQFAELKQQQVAQIRATQKEIDTQNQLLQESRSAKQSALKSKQREQDQLSRDERRQKQMLTELKKKEKDLKAQIAKQQKKVDELNNKIDALVREQNKKQTTTTLTKEQQLINGDFEANKGRLPWPVEKGFISGYFGKHTHPVYEHVTIDNKGIYLQTTAGSKARAVFKGTITSCIVLGGTYAVIIQHGNYRSVYSGLKSLSVKQGDTVNTKQEIGTIFTDPDQDNKTELYFQIYKETTIQNPSLWLAK